MDAAIRNYGRDDVEYSTPQAIPRTSRNYEGGRAVKIIREGSLSPQSVRFECRVCKCIFEAIKNLEARRVSDQRDGDYYECGCPTCQNKCTKQA